MKIIIPHSYRPAKQEHNLFNHRISGITAKIFAVGVLLAGGFAARSAAQNYNDSTKTKLADSYATPPAATCDVNPMTVPAQQAVSVNVSVVFDLPAGQTADPLPTLFLGRSSSDGSSVSLGALQASQQDHQARYSISVTLNEPAPTVISLQIASGDPHKFFPLPCVVIVEPPGQGHENGSTRDPKWGKAAAGIAIHVLENSLASKGRDNRSKNSGNSGADWGSAATQIGTEVVKELFSKKEHPNYPRLENPTPQNVPAVQNLAPPAQELPPPAVTATLTMVGGTNSADTSKGLSLVIDASFTNITDQQVTGVEVYRGTPESPTHIAWLQRVPGSPDTAPSFQATFTLPAGEAGSTLGVRGQVIRYGKGMSVASAPLVLPPQPKHTPWFAIGAGIAGLLVVMGAAIVIVVSRKHKRGPASPKTYAVVETASATRKAEVPGELA